MNRIADTFQRLRSSGKKALIPYITPEFPSQGITLPLLQILEQSGAEMVEIGIPFSDPLADGKIIQHSSEVALRNGVTVKRILDLVGEFRKKSSLPLLLMGYINPILSFGIDRFFRESSMAGVDGVIIPDLPPEESAMAREEGSRAGVSMVFLIAPTSSNDRIRTIDQLSTDFSYCVSVTGVTGARKELGLNGSLDQFLRRVKENTRKPFVVGFGISNADQVRRVWQFADGAVVGSALLRVLEGAGEREVLQKAGTFFKSLRPS